MAELCIRVRTSGPEPLGQDGDVVVAENNRLIQCSNLGNIICHPFKNAPNLHGLCPSGGHVEEWFKRTWRWKCEQVSPTEYLMTDQFGLDPESPYLIGPKPNHKGWAVDLPKFIFLRMRNRRKDDRPKMPIFGNPGSWVWYRGESRLTQADLDHVWNKVETDTPQRKSDWATTRPRGNMEMRTHLILKVDDFSDADNQSYNSPVMGTGDLGEPLMLKKYSHNVEYWDVPVVKNYLSTIRDRSQYLNIRDREYQRSSILIDKQAIALVSP